MHKILYAAIKRTYPNAVTPAQCMLMSDALGLEMSVGLLKALFMYALLLSFSFCTLKLSSSLLEVINVRIKHYRNQCIRFSYSNKAVM